ncbi:uncharacterized protein LOC112520307 [Cynara cardunculus var. scolymus]|uniref:uncharacterized protein LOC112520307 n=1 Tax=Cynara cardunculus var. scolymus TaxID=59895 RepID=UPI000D62F0D0|nr:uncharacterized protein LOC112520307 [Cynara cardunculus var. scolymus]
MEVATIDWKDSKFEKDEVYEHIDAPQWIDLSANHPPLHHDDDAWFCRPDCDHPKTADDFFIKTFPNPSKLQRSANVSENPPVDDQNQSNTPMKKRGTPMNINSRSAKHVQDNENQNPNCLSPADHPVKLSEEKKAENSSSVSEETPRKLKSTFSARNLFAGNNILNQITEFCNELKRLATRTKQSGDEHGEKQIEQKKPGAGVLKEREVQRKPLLEATKVKHEDIEKSSSNGKDKLTRKIRNTGLENSPIAETTKSTRRKAEKRVFQILTTKATPPKAFWTRPQF